MKLDYSFVPKMPLGVKPRSLELPPVMWEKLIQELNVGEHQFRFRPMDKKDISEVLHLYRTYLSHFFKASTGFFLEESFYRTQCCLLSD